MIACLRHLLLLAMIPPSLAALPAIGAPLTAADEADVARLERYLNNISTLDSQFVQFANSGLAEGRIYLSRPGDMRIEYQPPVPVLMVASGRLLMYYDSALKQTSFLPVSRTPAHFFLRPKIDLTDGLTITDLERGPASLRLTLVESENPDAGSITLVFEDNPLRLIKWRIVDLQGQEVEVVLLEPRFGVQLDDDLFDLVDPNLIADD